MIFGALLEMRQIFQNISNSMPQMFVINRKQDSYMDFKLPSTNCFISKDFVEGDGETFPEEPLACFTFCVNA